MLGQLRWSGGARPSRGRPTKRASAVGPCPGTSTAAAEAADDGDRRAAPARGDLQIRLCCARLGGADERRPLVLRLAGLTRCLKQLPGDLLSPRRWEGADGASPPAGPAGAGVLRGRGGRGQPRRPRHLATGPRRCDRGVESGQVALKRGRLDTVVAGLLFNGGHAPERGERPLLGPTSPLRPTATGSSSPSAAAVVTVPRLVRKVNESRAGPGRMGPQRGNTRRPTDPDNSRRSPARATSSDPRRRPR